MNNEDYKKKLIHRAFILAQKTIALTDTFPNKRSAWIITDQLIRAVTSIGANIIEAQAASSKKNFTNFLSHALKSSNESKFWFALAKDLGLQQREIAKMLLDEVDELAKILGSSIATLKGKNRL